MKPYSVPLPESPLLLRPDKLSHLLSSIHEVAYNPLLCPLQALGERLVRKSVRWLTLSLTDLTHLHHFLYYQLFSFLDALDCVGKLLGKQYYKQSLK